MSPKIPEILAELRRYQATEVIDGARFQTRQTPLMAELLTILANEQTTAAAKMEQYTERLVAQTDRLVAFTKGRYVFTAALLLIGIIQIILTFSHP